MRQLVFLCFILLFNCHNAQKKWGHNKYPWKNK